MTKDRHILGVSGGRDSAALAVFMRQHHPELPIEYFFTDTGKELPEVYVFLDKLEGFLGKPIERLHPDRDFDFWLAEYFSSFTSNALVYQAT
jgi:3'-phosphoadenosine 5'-phosphosulfate sulfotransferase (PAPS reductase)/FAD synthetase